MQSERKSVRVPSKAGTVLEESVPHRLERSPRWHGRIPARVLLDPTLSGEAIRFYGLLAMFVFKGNTTNIGLRKLGEAFGVSQQTAMRRVKELVEAKHVEVLIASGKRSVYLMKSPVFDPKVPVERHESKFSNRKVVEDWKKSRVAS